MYVIKWVLVWMYTTTLLLHHLKKKLDTLSRPFRSRSKNAMIRNLRPVLHYNWFTLGLQVSFQRRSPDDTTLSEEGYPSFPL
jgi:hypothetical protein